MQHNFKRPKNDDDAAIKFTRDFNFFGLEGKETQLENFKNTDVLYLEFCMTDVDKFGSNVAPWLTTTIDRPWSRQLQFAFEGDAEVAVSRLYIDQKTKQLHSEQYQNLRVFTTIS